MGRNPTVSGPGSRERITFNKMVDKYLFGAIFNQMIEFQSAPLDSVFHALADPTRRAMLAELASGERSVGELAAPFEMSLAAASKHIQTLERAGLIKRDVRGRTHVCALDPQPLADANAWLKRYARFWNERLDALEAILSAEVATTASPIPDEHRDA